MANTHRVKQGECLSSIAARYGITNPLVIYHHPQNSRLRENRPNPDILMPGDEVFVPAAERRKEDIKTEEKHRFLRKVHRTRLRIVILDELHEPAAHVNYILTVGERNIEGITNEEGLLEEIISPEIVNASLIIWLPLRKKWVPGEGGSTTVAGGEDNQGGEKSKNIQKQVLKLKIGYLNPNDDVTGVQARLMNLGYRFGPIDGIFGPKTSAAIRRFQRDQGLPQNGELTQSLRQTLVAVHGC